MTEGAARWAEEVLSFWFGLSDAQHWQPDPALDALVRERFGALWAEQRDGVAAEFLDSADEALAAIVLFDQFPRNMSRGHADQFSTDALALAIAREAVARGFDEQVAPARRLFFYLPFEHSEELEDQRQSLLLFTRLGDPRYLDFARKHHDVIARFGRFPHRNAMLGRRSTPEEQAFGLDPPW